MHRSERRAVLLLFLLVATGLSTYIFYDTKIHRTEPTILPEDSLEEDYALYVDTTAARPYARRPWKKRPWKKWPKREWARHRYEAPPYSSYGEQRRTPSSFAFDPNTADSTALLALGLSPTQVRNIYKYRARGGQYHRKEDFHRLYGLTQEQWEHLEPLIDIDKRFQYVEPWASDTAHRDTVRHPVKFTVRETLPLNRCDTTTLKHIPGIGSGYARRIVRYRERLGGYVSTSQLHEIEEMPKALADTLAKWFVVETDLVQKINVNALSLSRLRRHPYINFYQARVITEHRRLYGPLHSLDDLRLYEEFTPHDLERLAPYVSF